MPASHDNSPRGEQGRSSDTLVESLGKGRHLRADAARALAALLEAPVGREGLSRFFQPGFPGVRTFVVETRADPDQTVELTLVGISRDGAPVWTGTRIFLRGREGALEIHHGFEEVDPAFRSRNFIGDSLRRELSLLEAVEHGPSARITVDAEGVGGFICALHGFVFADETDEGPPARSARSRDPASDRTLLISAAPSFVQALATRFNLESSTADRALRLLCESRTPWEFARADVAGVPLDVPESEHGLAGGLGRAFLLWDETPAWRAALYRLPIDSEAHRTGEEYRRRQTERAELRIATEMGIAREQLAAPQRAIRLRGLETLAQLGAPWVLGEVRALADDPDRRVATAARHTVRAMSGADLAERIAAYAEDRSRPPRLRGLAYRVLSEYFPSQIAPRVSMLRVNPDARVQRAVIPLLAEHPTEAGPELASMLAANPWGESPVPRPGLLELRVELIERLALRPDPRTLLPLIAALSAQPPPPPAEMLALTRALVAYPDPRARVALSAASQRLDRPAVP